MREAKGGFARGERDPKGVIQLRMNNVTNRGRFDWSSFIRVPADSDTIAAYRLQTGDVLFNNTNSTDLVGKTALFESHDEPIVFSNHFTRLRTPTDRLSPRFLALWLQSQWQQRVFANICNRWIGQSAVQRDKLLALEIPLPPLAEQRRIAAILSEQMAAVEQGRSAAEARVEAAKALPAAYLRAVFNRPEAQQWPRKRLGEVCKIVMGQSPDGASYNFDRVGEPLLNGPTEFGPTHPTPAQWTTAPVRFAEPGDILFCVRGATTGRMNLADRRYCIGRGLAALRYIHGPVDQDFLRFLISTVKDELLRETAGSTFPNLQSEKLQQLYVALPPVYEQRRIAAILSEQMAAVEQARKALEEQLEAINQLPGAVLRRAFSGEL